MSWVWCLETVLDATRFMAILCSIFLSTSLYSITVRALSWSNMNSPVCVIVSSCHHNAYHINFAFFVCIYQYLINRFHFIASRKWFYCFYQTDKFITLQSCHSGDNPFIWSIAFAFKLILRKLGDKHGGNIDQDYWCWIFFCDGQNTLGSISIYYN